MQQQFYHNPNINASQKLPGYEDWLDSRPIKEADLDDMFEQFREDRRQGKLASYSLSFTINPNHQPTRYADSIAQVIRQHRYNLHPSLTKAVKMSMFCLLTKAEKHGYSRQAVAISRLSFVDAMTEYLKLIAVLAVIVQAQTVSSHGPSEAYLRYQRQYAFWQHNLPEEAYKVIKPTLDRLPEVQYIKNEKNHVVEKTIEQIKNCNCNGRDREPAHSIKFIGFAPDVSHEDYENWLEEVQT